MSWRISGRCWVPVWSRKQGCCASTTRCRPIYEVCTAPKLLDRVEQLLGPDLVLLYSHIMSKPPGGRRVAWHQDGPYWHRLDPKIAVTAWVALDDATPENG